MSSPFAGERIRTARAIYGITQEDLERSAGVSQALLSYIERGQRPATDDVINAIARALDLPAEFFNVVPEDVPLDSLRFRKQKTASVTTTKRAQALFQEGFRVSRTLTERSRYPMPTLPVAQGELDDEAIIGIAAETRVALQLAHDVPVPHLTRLIERAGVPVGPIVLPDLEDNPLTDNRHFGLSYWAGPGEPAFIGYFPGHQGDRDRFTVAHEIGHLVLHSKRQASDPEREANLFAGELLLPRHRAIDVLSPSVNLREFAQLKRVWGMSIQALVMRAKQVGAIDDARSTSLWKQINARGWRRNEPVIVQPEQPALLRRLALHLYGDRPWSDLRREMALSTVLLKSLLDPQPGRVGTNDEERVVLDFGRARRSK